MLIGGSALFGLSLMQVVNLLLYIIVYLQDLRFLLVLERLADVLLLLLVLLSLVVAVSCLLIFSSLADGQVAGRFAGRLAGRQLGRRYGSTAVRRGSLFLWVVLVIIV